MTGEGENKDDYWVLYVRDGKSQEERGEVTYPEFDPAKLV